MTNNIFFGIILTVGSFTLSKKLAQKTGSTLLNPLLVSSILAIIFLIAFKIPYKDFNIGGQYFTKLITPATVALAIPLYKNLDTLIQNLKLIFIAIVTAITTHFLAIIGFAFILNLNLQMVLSLIPKSITTAFAKDISSNLGGIEIITVSVVIVTGIFGAAISDIVNNKMRFEDDIAIGLALGSSAHAIGTSKAVENNEIQATFSSLALILTGITTVLIAPLFALIVNLLF